MCDGRSLSRDEYRALFNVLGTEFGPGDVSGSTFNLPNAQGRVMGLIGTSVGNDWVDGDTSGEEEHTLTIAEMPAHNHDISGGYLNVSGGVDPSGNGNTGVSGEHTHTTNSNAPSIGLAQRTGSNTLTVSDSSPNELDLVNALGLTINSAGAHRHQIASNGGSLPHNNMQPTLFLGNLFIYCGRITHNLAGPDGVSPVSVNPSYYPPSTPANRLY